MIEENVYNYAVQSKKHHGIFTYNVLQIIQISQDISTVAFECMFSKTAKGDHLPKKV